MPRLMVFFLGVIFVVAVGALAASIHVLRAERRWVDDHFRTDQRYDR